MGIILAALYILLMYQRTMTGPVREGVSGMSDLRGREVLAIAPVLDLKEAFDRPQLQAREMLLQDEQGQLHIGNPIKFRHEPAQIDTRLPGLGEHTASVLAQTPVRKDPT